MAPDHLGLEAVRQALVALGALDQLGRRPGPGQLGDGLFVPAGRGPEGLAVAVGQLGQAPVAELGDEQRPAQPGPLPGLGVQLGQPGGVQAAVPVGGQHRGGEHPLRVGLDPVVLDQRAGRVGLADGPGDPAGEPLVAGPAPGRREVEAELVHGRPEDHARVVGVPADLGGGGPRAPVGQLPLAVQVVVGDRLGHRHVAVQQHPQLVAGVQVARVERLDVEPQGVEPGRLGRGDLLADGVQVALGVQRVGPEPLDEGAAHPVGPAVQQQPVPLDPHLAQPVADGRAVAPHPAGAGLDHRGVQHRIVRSPTGGPGRSQPDGRLRPRPRAELEAGLGGQPHAGRGQPHGHRSAADVLDPHRQGQVVGVAGAPHPADGHRPVPAEGDRLPDAAVGHVEAGRAGEDVVGPALLAVGQPRVQGPVDRRVGDPDGQLVRPGGQGGRRVELERGEGEVVAPKRPAVQVHLGQVHHRPEAQRPVAPRVVQGEPAPVPGDAVQLEQPLGLPQPGDPDRPRLEAVQGGQLVVAGVQLPGAVQRPAAVADRLEACGHGHLTRVGWWQSWAGRQTARPPGRPRPGPGRAGRRPRRIRGRAG